MVPMVYRNYEYHEYFVYSHDGSRSRNDLIRRYQILQKLYISHCPVSAAGHPGGCYGTFFILDFAEITRGKYMAPMISAVVLGLGVLANLVQYMAEKKRNIN